MLLNDNLLGGRMPPEWSALTSLAELHLGGNSFSGTLPQQWSGLSPAFDGAFRNLMNQVAGNQNRDDLDSAVSSSDRSQGTGYWYYYPDYYFDYYDYFDYYYGFF
mmetsp:Transcript_23055/g.55160  ORF Transcript_23055/g.55160 Transcript_23055/m.55160 type:complete len:105 (+) Transcript_23055:705-1019(+)